ncbi:hypothetical protein Bca4012_036857 [Brassica carinata]
MSLALLPFGESSTIKRQHSCKPPSEVHRYLRSYNNAWISEGYHQEDASLLHLAIKLILLDYKSTSLRVGDKRI